MQLFSVPNTDYHATPALTGIDPSKFDEYFSDRRHKQVQCAAHPHCISPSALKSSNSPHRCVGIVVDWSDMMVITTTSATVSTLREDETIFGCGSDENRKKIVTHFRKRFLYDFGLRFFLQFCDVSTKIVTPNCSKIVPVYSSFVTCKSCTRFVTTQKYI